MVDAQMQLVSRQSLASSLGKLPYPVRQFALGMAYPLVPRRIPNLLPLAAVTLRDLPKIGKPLVPSVNDALDRPDGLCGLAGRIGVAELVEGYARGMFVMSHIGPLKWWAPRHRMVLFFDQTRIEKSARRLIRNGRFRITFDEAFREVVSACAAPRAGATPLTWITPRMAALLAEAHAEGHAHSVEVWEEGALVGGLFGLAVGRVFFTESQFHMARDASKVAFALLNRHLQAWGFAMNDGKFPTRYLAQSGMLPILREEFCMLTERFCRQAGKPGRWEVDASLCADEWAPAESPRVRMADLLPVGSRCADSVEELMTTKRSNSW
jgi:leucyl/phenylalanyl-tRNA---protein transferase